MGEGLHPRRLKILNFLASRKRDGEETPSEREICSAVGLKSSQTVHHHLGTLEADGYIERSPGRSPGQAPGRKKRVIKLTEKGWGALSSAPMLGRVAAGRGLEAIAVGDEAYSLVAELLVARASGRARYLLRVTGQSMTGAWIGDGSILVVEEDENPPDGEVVVALLRGGEEVTVKRLFRERGAGGDSVRLRAENGEHKDIVAPAEEVVVQGRVVNVIHPPRRSG
jgi:repressor LexA